jgi:hypothetical protein
MKGYFLTPDRYAHSRRKKDPERNWLKFLEPILRLCPQFALLR